jgi:hypothetical protein
VNRPTPSSSSCAHSVHSWHTIRLPQLSPYFPLPQRYRSHRRPALSSYLNVIAAFVFSTIQTCPSYVRFSDTISPFIILVPSTPSTDTYWDRLLSSGSSCRSLVPFGKHRLCPQLSLLLPLILPYHLRKREKRFSKGCESADGDV